LKSTRSFPKNRIASSPFRYYGRAAEVSPLE
jgi:hypothetical protein